MPRSKHTHLLLARIARGSFANDLLPAFLFVKLLKMRCSGSLSSAWETKPRPPWWWTAAWPARRTSPRFAHAVGPLGLMTRHHPLAHGQFRSRFDQPVEHHQLSQQARFVREPCFCQHLLQAKPLPDLMAHMHGAGLTGLLYFEGFGVKLDPSGCEVGVL